MTCERRVTREAEAMTRKEILMKAIEGRLTWMQAADILGLTARQLRRLRAKYEEHGFGGLRDGRSGTPRRKRIPLKTIEELLRLRRERYPDFSIKHFHEFATEKHKLELSYTWTRLVLQEAGLAPKAPARGKYRRKRERRPMTGMMLHLDGSKHEWIAGLPWWDLMVMLDDADGRMLYARFVPEEGTMPTLAALKHVLVRYGRFCELYTDRGSHFCRTGEAEVGPDEIQTGQVSRALKVLGIRQILARSPEARGRSERAFGTIQGRLPQELKMVGIKTYEAANKYLEEVFVPDFNRRFTVEPTEKESAFVRLTGINLDLLLSGQHDRVVRGDSTVLFDKLVLQLPHRRERRHYVRCPVIVHELLDGSLAVTFQGKVLARYDRRGEMLSNGVAKEAA
jgi:transposase